MAERHWYIKNCRLFEKLSADQLSRLELRARMRRFPKGSPVYLPSDTSTSVFLLAEGRVKLCSVTPEGKQAILAFIEPGELFGELALFHDADSDEYAETMAKTTLVMMPRDAVEALMYESPGLVLSVHKLMGLRRRRIERRLKSLLFRSNRDRLVHLLLELTGQYGHRTAEGIHLRIPLSHQDLASIIGATRETVTTLLGELQLAGYIKVARQKLMIRNLNGLAAMVESPIPILPEAVSISRPPDQQEMAPDPQGRAAAP